MAKQSPEKIQTKTIRRKPDPSIKTLKVPTTPLPRGRPPSQTTAVAKAIYFRDNTQVKNLEEILTKHPRASSSSVIQQLVGGFIEAYKANKLQDNKVELSVTVYL